MQGKVEKFKNRRTLATTLALAFLGVSVVVLLIAMISQMFFNFRAQQETIYSKLYLVAQDAANTVGGFVQQQFSVLEAASKFGDLTSTSRQEQKRTLEHTLGFQPAFRRLVFLDLWGRELVTASRVPQAMSGRLIDETDTGVLKQVSQGRRYASPVYVDEVTSEPLMILAVPVNDVFGDPKGILVAELNLKFMWNLVDTLEVGQTGWAYVVDRQGLLIAFEDTARVLQGENVSQLREVSKFINAPEAEDVSEAGMFSGIKGTTVLGAYAALDTPDWAVVTELPIEEAYQELIRSTIISLIITLAVVALAAFIGVTVARQLAAPLLNLTKTAERITGGDIESQAAIEGPAEVASLAAAFNQMTARLRDLIADLEQRMIGQQQAEGERDRLQQEVIEAQRQAIRDLSSPVIPVMDRIIVMPLNGSIDTMRARDITRSLLDGISAHQANVVILDITGVSIIDSGVAGHLNKTIQAARLKGAHTIVTGISDAVAETIVDLGIDWSNITTLSNLQTGLVFALNRLGFKLAKP